MADSLTHSDGIEVPKPDQWPGAFASYKMVKPFVKPEIWNFVSVVGICLVILLVFETISGVVFRHAIAATLVNDLVSIVVGALLQATFITMYFACLKGDEFTLKTALSYSYQRILKMIGLIFILYVIFIVSFVLLIIPFLFIAPRIILAPYFLILNDCSVSEALAASWHSTKGHVKIVYEIFGVELLIALAFITIIGIPFAIYWGIINSASLALLTLYLSQPGKSEAKLKKA